MGRERGTGSIYVRRFSPDAGFSGGSSGKDRLWYDISNDGVRYGDYLYRILAMYAIGELFNQGPLFDLREVHHIDDNVSNYKPSNLIIAENRRQHKMLDKYTRVHKLSSVFVPVRLKGAVYVGDIIRDDGFDIEIALAWWREQVT